MTLENARFVYLAVILDGFSRKVVGWALERTTATRLPKAALEQALAERQPPPELVHHSDRGVQYASHEYVQVLQEHQMIPSMSQRPEEFEQQFESTAINTGATMSFSGMRRTYLINWRGFARKVALSVQRSGFAA